MPNSGRARVTWQFTLTGLLVGTLVGLTGMGGGSLMTPILVIIWGVNPTIAIGSRLVVRRAVARSAFMLDKNIRTAESRVPSAS